MVKCFIAKIIYYKPKIFNSEDTLEEYDLDIQFMFISNNPKYKNKLNPIKIDEKIAKIPISKIFKI